MVSACSRTEALLAEPAVEQADLRIERADDPEDAIARVERGDAPDVVVLSRSVADPVRLAQRLHSLDRDGAVVVLCDADAQEELRHALEVAPFLEGDVGLMVVGDADALVLHLEAAAARTHARREQAGTRRQRRETPPPLSARYLGTLLDSVPLGLVTLDAGGAVIGWNRRAGEMLEVPEVEALGRVFTDFFDTEDSERLAALIAEVGTSGIHDEGEVFWRNGHAFELTGARFAIRSGEGGTLLILQDVTKRELAERELRLQKALSDAQADTSRAGIVVTTLDGELVRANKRFGEIWGVTTQELRADQQRARSRLLEQVDEPDLFLEAARELAATGGGEYRDEVTLKDGRVIERYATHVRDDEGTVVGYIWFHTDITPQRREEDALRFLADATNLLSSSLDYETTLRSVAELAVARMADWCTVEIAEQDGGHRTVAISHRHRSKVELAREFRERYPEIDSGAVAVAIRTGESQVFPQLTDEAIATLARSEEHLAMLRDLDPRSAMIVPIMVRERIFGAINFIRSRPGSPYDKDDVALAEELARRAAIAIDNSRVHAELRETARTLQESLLPPHLPAAPGLELAARFRPAGAGMQVGGDFYDIFETSAGCWGVAIGDVCGKGAEAAALTALTRYTVRAAAMYENDPAGVLRVLNEALLRQRGDYRFTTLAFSLIETAAERCTLRAAAGGHPRPLLLRPDGTTQAVGGGGPLLGVDHQATFREEQVDLEAGDVLVFYTDGLTDALAPQRMLAETDLLTALAACRGLSAGEISQRLEDVALGGAYSRVPRDDIALVVAKLA